MGSLRSGRRAGLVVAVGHGQSTTKEETENPRRSRCQNELVSRSSYAAEDETHGAIPKSRARGSRARTIDGAGHSHRHELVLPQGQPLSGARTGLPPPPLAIAVEQASNTSNLHLCFLSRRLIDAESVESQEYPEEWPNELLRNPTVKV